MKEEKKNTYKVLLDNSITSDHCLTLIKLPSYEEIHRYNSEKFSKILADKIVFISASTSRVDAKFNPHIAKELIENNCNNWRVDRWQYLEQKTFSYDEIRSYYEKNFANIMKKLVRKNKIKIDSKNKKRILFFYNNKKSVNFVSLFYIIFSI